MTLDEHLAHGYDFYVHGVFAKWNPRMLVSDLGSDDTLRTQAVEKLRELDRVVAAGRQCDITRVQKRILDAGFAAA